MITEITLNATEIKESVLRDLHIENPTTVKMIYNMHGNSIKDCSMYIKIKQGEEECK